MKTGAAVSKFQISQSCSVARTADTSAYTEPLTCSASWDLLKPHKSPVIPPRFVNEIDV